MTKSDSQAGSPRQEQWQHCFSKEFFQIPCIFLAGMVEWEGRTVATGRKHDYDRFQKNKKECLAWRIAVRGTVCGIPVLLRAQRARRRNCNNHCGDYPGNRRGDSGGNHRQRRRHRDAVRARAVGLPRTAQSYPAASGCRRTGSRHSSHTFRRCRCRRIRGAFARTGAVVRADGRTSADYCAG